jgi:hypothetical protein
MTRRLFGDGWRILTVAAALVGATGCGSKGLVPVEGRVRFGGKSPPGPGYLFFVPREMSKNLKQDRTGALPGTALFMRDGGFRATTFTDGDGLRPGAYEVRVECSAAPTKPVDLTTHDAAARDLVPQAFQPPDLVVPASGPRPVRYDLDVR